jgi:hypothetical protein
MNRGTVHHEAEISPGGAILWRWFATIAATGSAFWETAMHAHQVQPHYAPSSVGALMDPAFLRNAVIDANGDRRAESIASPSLQRRWRMAIDAIAAAFRRH